MRPFLLVAVCRLFAPALILGTGGTSLWGAPIEIVKDGQPRAQIVIPDQPAPLTGKWTLRENAAALLQDYLKRSTGAELPIVKESEATSEDFRILLGQTKYAENELGIDPNKLPGEGYEIKSFPQGVAIVGQIDAEGRDTGTLFGIYDFLERVAGIRWYFPGKLGTIVPSHPTLEIPDQLEIRNHPAFALRMGGVGGPTGGPWEWHPVLRFGIREGMVANHDCETWTYLYGKTHPEYFGLRKDGTRAVSREDLPTRGENRSFLCYSEPGVLQQYLENIDHYFATGDITPWRRSSAQPRGNLIPFGGSDTTNICQCEKCQAQLDSEQGKFGIASNLMFGFLAKLAKEVKKRHPEAVFWALAYPPYQLPPTRVTLPDNVGITLCLLPTMVQMADPTAHKKISHLIKSWSDLLGQRRDRLVIWDYFCYPNMWFVAPTEIPDLMAEQARFTRDISLGWFNNGLPSKSDSPNKYLTYRIVWLMHQLLWNPDADVNVLRQHWCADLFGPAGKTMDRFYQALENDWQKTAWSQSTAETYAVANHLVYGETYTPERVAVLKKLLDQAQAEGAAGSLYAQRLTWFRETAFDPFFKAADTFHSLSGQTSTHHVHEISGPTAKTSVFDDAIWKQLEPLKMRNRLDGTISKPAGEVRLASDDTYLYITADFKVAPGTEIKASTKENQSPQIYDDDKFIIHLMPEAGQNFLELIVNPRGVWSGEGGLLARAGMFGQRPDPWSPQDIHTSGSVDPDEGWQVQVAIPWSSFPGSSGHPSRLQAQFLRWDHDQAYEYEAWAPTLDSWNYGPSSFGSLILEDTNRKKLL